MTISNWLMENAPFVSAMVSPSVRPENRPVLTRWAESAVIAALSTFGALQINDRLQDERISTQNSRLASIEVKIDKFNAVERNSVEIREVRARVDRIERYLDRINNSYDKKKDE